MPTPGTTPRADVLSPRSSPRGSPRGGALDELEGPARGERGATPRSNRSDPDSREEPRTSKVEEKAKAFFIDRPIVNTFFALLVVTNAMYIGLETQLRASNSNSVPEALLMAIEIMYAFLFFVELLLRLYADRCPKFLKSWWNVMDLGLVCLSIVDLFITLVLATDNQSSSGSVGKFRAVRLLKVLRFARLIRLVRLLRFKGILRMLRDMFVLIRAIVAAVKALGLVMSIFFLITYICGIITTEFLGLANDSNDDLISEWFGDLLKSMFTLYQLSTLAEWSVISRHVSAIFGWQWNVFFMIYVLATNTILMNVVLATLIENVLTISSDVKEAHENGVVEEGAEWMITPESLTSEQSDDGAAQENDDDGPKKADTSMKTVDELAVQTLSEVYDLISAYVGVEGVNQRRLVTERSLHDGLHRLDVQGRMNQALPALRETSPDKVARQIWDACPWRLDKEGLNRQEFAEASLALCGQLSMNHFVTISQALVRMERHTEHELTHLNKHQRKINRRFLKLRHRLRKIYHFDGAPRKMVELVNEMKRNKQAGDVRVASKTRTASRNATQRAPAKRGDSDEDSGEISLSDSSDGDKAEDGW